MRGYFPFTDYDFYAYLTSGSLLLGVIDFVFNKSKLIAQNDWTFVQILLAVASAYVLGHLIAWLSQLVVEMWIMRHLLSPPANIQLGFVTPNWFERALGHAIGRYYEPLTDPVRKKVLEAASGILKCKPDELTNSETVFQLAHGRAMSIEATRQRSDEFRNVYGLFRNVTLVGALSFGMFVWSGWFADGGENAKFLALLAVLFSAAAFVRFAKFYASFSSEIVRALLKN